MMIVHVILQIPERHLKPEQSQIFQSYSKSVLDMEFKGTLHVNKLHNNMYIHLLCYDVSVLFLHIIHQ